MDFSLTNAKASLIAGTSIIAMTILAFMIFPSFEASSFSVIGISIIILLDVTISLSLYFLFKPTSKTISLAMSSARIIYAFIFAVALYNISDVNLFFSIWENALILFGIHLLFLGYLVYRSGCIPRLIGILVVIASFGYIIDGVSKLAGYPLEIGIFTFFGELILAIWLIVKGRKLSDETSISK